MPSLFSWRPKIQIRTRKYIGAPDNQTYAHEHPAVEGIVQHEVDLTTGTESGNLVRDSDESPTRSVRFADSINGVNRSTPSTHRPPTNPMTVAPSAVGSPGSSRHPPFTTSVPVLQPGHQAQQQFGQGRPQPYYQNYQQHSPRAQHGQFDNVAPLARDEVDDAIVHAHNQPPPRPIRLHSSIPAPRAENPPLPRKENRANILLKQLRDDDGAQSESSEMSANEQTLSMPPPAAARLQSGLNSMGKLRSIIFLQYNDEVKRSLLPPNLTSLDQLKRLFLRSFPNLTTQYVNSPHVKLYIQEASKGQLFYELDDLKDIKDRSVIRLREQSNGYQSPPPVRFTGRPPTENFERSQPTDYFSEPEVDDYRSRPPPPSYRMRPASAVPADGGGSYNPQNGIPPRPPRSGPVGGVGSASNHFEPYYDPYYVVRQYDSDSSQGPRSGSVTPVIDPQTRLRMESMERQLAGLSSLVHSALLSKGMSEATQRDMLDLRRQILEIHPEVERRPLFAPNQTGGSLVSSSASSIHVSNPEGQLEIQICRKILKSLKEDLRQLREDSEATARKSQEILAESFEKIRIFVQNIEHSSPQPLNINLESAANPLKTEHLTQLTTLQEDLQSFETGIENIRRSVVNTNRKLRMSEVEDLTNKLTHIGRNAAKLKTDYPQVQNEIERNMRRDIERIMKEDNELKDGAQHIDNCLRRCKALANMMVTMKKLAMVQDPEIRRDRSTSRSAAEQEATHLKSVAVVSPIADDLETVIEDPKTEIHNPAPQLPPVPAKPSLLPKPVAPNANKATVNGNHVLDSILDELNSPTSQKRKPPEMSASLTLRVLARPQEREAPPEPNRKYATSERDQPESMQNGTHHSTHVTTIAVSESISQPEAAREKAQLLGESNERIQTQQRELNNQLERLQQLCP